MPGFWWSLISAALAVLAGLILIARPIEGLLTLTVVLTAFFIMEGIASIMFALEHKRELSGRWGWVVAAGVFDLLIAVDDLCRPAGIGGLGHRPAGRHQHGVRRLVADRHGARGQAEVAQRACSSPTGG